MCYINITRTSWQIWEGRLFGRLLPGISNLPHVAHEGHTCRRTDEPFQSPPLPAGSAFHYPCLTCGRSVSRNLYNLRDAMRSILSCSPSFPAFRIVNSRTTRLIQSSSLGVRSPLRFETPNDGAYALFVDLLDDGNTSGEGVRIYSLLEIRPSGIEGRASRWIDLGLSIKRSGLELVSLSRRLKRFNHHALAAIPFSKTPAALPRSTGQLP